MIIKTNYGDLEESQYSQFTYFVNLINDIGYDGNILNLNMLIGYNYSKEITLSELIKLYNNCPTRNYIILNKLIKYYKIYWTLEFINLDKLTDNIFNGPYLLSGLDPQLELSLELIKRFTANNYKHVSNSHVITLLTWEDFYLVCCKFKYVMLKHIITKPLNLEYEISKYYMDKFISEFKFINSHNDVFNIKKYKNKNILNVYGVDINKWAQNKIIDLINNYSENENKIIFQLNNLKMLILLTKFIEIIYNNKNKIPHKSIYHLFWKFDFNIMYHISKLPDRNKILHENDDLVKILIKKYKFINSDLFQNYLEYKYFIQKDDFETIKNIIPLMNADIFLSITLYNNPKYYKFYEYLIESYKINIKKYILTYKKSEYSKVNLIKTTYNIGYNLCLNYKDIEIFIKCNLGKNNIFIYNSYKSIIKELKFHCKDTNLNILKLLKKI